MTISEATTPADYSDGKALIEEYATELGVDLCFQNFDDELSNLKEIYGPPHGCLLLAWGGTETIGCVAVRQLRDDTCEMKRLYVKPHKRGSTIGRRLAQTAINRAHQLGYRRMVLDTLPSMTAARSLYQSLGFKEIDAYYGNPLPGVQYLGLHLYV